MSSLKLVSGQMLDNVTISRQMNDWQVECHQNCPTYPCSVSYCLTSGYLGARSTFFSRSNVRVETSTHPTSFVTSYPQVPLLDFIIYVLSSLGTWFGLVIVSCNPMNLIKSGERQEEGEHETSETRSSNRLQTLRRRNLARNRFYSQYHNN